MAHQLDSLSVIQKLDQANQRLLLADFPKHLEAGWWEAAAVPLPAAYRTTASTVLCGMGGSAIGADIVTALPREHLKGPLAVVRGYNLPPGIGAGSLVAIVSYSGNTEETLSCFHQALKARAKIVTLSKGGALAALAHKHNLPQYRIPDTVIPRASLAYQSAALINFLTRTRKIQPSAGSLTRCMRLLAKLNHELIPETPEQKNPAKALARFLQGRLPLVIGAGILEPVARRLKDQINENAKTFAVFEFLPELNHNLTEGLQFPARVIKQLGAVLLENDFDHPQIKKRFAALKKLFRKLGVPYRSIPSVGADVWSQKFSSIAVGDWASFYLAIVNRVDPSPVPIIEWTKKQLH